MTGFIGFLVLHSDAWNHLTVLIKLFVWQQYLQTIEYKQMNNST